MRDSIGGTQLFIIVIALVILFTTFVAVGVNYSNAFSVKNKIVNIIERNNGLTDEAESEIQKFLSENGYLVTGNCDGDKETAININKSKECNGTGIVCVKANDSGDNNPGDVVQKFSFSVRVFYKLDIPIFSDAFTFNAKGTTKSMVANPNFKDLCGG